MIPVLPDELADLLDDASPAEDAASDAVVRAFIAEHTASTRPDVLAGLVAALRNKLEAGESRHQSTVTAMAGAMKEAAAGFYSAREAIDTLWPMFLHAVTQPPASPKQGQARSKTQAAGEFAGITAWAVGQALAADPDETRTRVNDKMPPGGEEIGGFGAEPADGFFDQRPTLARIRDFARARRVCPWSVLGAVLVRATCQIPPHVVLPPLVGGAVAVNLSVALVGPPGGGKGGSETAARDAVTFTGFTAVVDIPELPIGSGEGIARTFADNGPDTVHTVIFTAAEIETLAALFRRQGGTVEAELRKLWMGEALGFANAQKHTRIIVPRLSYRAGVIVGVQTLRASALLDGGDGGTPQRFLWLPVLDRDMPRQRPEPVDPITVSVNSWPGVAFAALGVPDCARAAIDAHQLAIHHSDPGVDPLGGHALLTRLKVAAALMVLDERQEISAADWELAEQVTAVSDQTRAYVQRAARQKASRDNRARAFAADERDEYAADRKLRRCKEAILRWLAKVPKGGYISRRDLRQTMKSDVRPYFDAAIAELIDEGRVSEVDLEHGTGYTAGPPVHRGPPQSTCDDDGPRGDGPKYTPNSGEKRDQGKHAEPPPPADNTAESTPGQSDTTQQTSADRASANGQPKPLRCRCGEEMVAPQSVARGYCERCHLTGKRGTGS